MKKSKDGSIVVDIPKHEILINGKHVYFSFTEFNLFNLLFKGQGVVFDRATIREKIWGDASSYQDSRLIDQHVSRIRGRLGKLSGCILTVPRVGYKFVYPK